MRAERRACLIMGTPGRMLMRYERRRRMSIRYGLLALLAEGEQHGYQLREAFLTRTGRVWSINIGQIYTTLNRLSRDGLVDRSSHSDSNTVTYRLTRAGREELSSWWAATVDHSTPGRDQVTIKVVLSILSSGGHATATIRRQRRETSSALGKLIEERNSIPNFPDSETLTRLLLLDRLILLHQAETSWLDLMERRLMERTG